jgi:E3 ubiquitin-protein ligase NRDP1
MSGYDLSRFIGLSQSESEELICSICQGIFRNPVVTNCCLQAFCEQCINNWLENNNTCPYDRQPLNRSQLLPSARFKSLN